MSLTRKISVVAAFLLVACPPLVAQTTDNSFKQDPSPQVVSTADLVSATATITGETATISFTVADGTPTSWHHVYFNTDNSGSTGFIHSANSTGGKGMDYLIEPDFLYHWNGGEDQAGWHWEKVASVQGVTSGNKVTYTFPAGLLNLKPDSMVSILVETMNDNYAVTLDTLPRDPGVWTIKATANGSPASAASPNTVPVLPPAAPDLHARERFKSIQSYACYYGPGGSSQLEALSKFDAVIVETRNLSPSDVATIKKKEGL